MSQHPNKGHVLPLEQALPLLVQMRLEGRSWPQVQHALGYSSRVDLNPLRWQRAAELKRDAPTLTWASIGADPAVDFAENTLAKKHKTATLACGLSFEEYLDGFRLAALEQLHRDQRDYGQRFKALFDGILSDVEAARERLLDFDLNPQQVPAELGKASGVEQLGLGFELLRGLPTETPQMTPAQQSWRNSETRALLGDLAGLHKLVQPLTAGADSAEDESAAVVLLPEPERQQLALEILAISEQLNERQHSPQTSGVA